MKRRGHFWICAIGLLIACAGALFWTKLRHTRLRMMEYEPPPPGMAFVPAGEFWMGSDDLDAPPDERPLRKVFVPAFYIDKFEVTNRRYKEFKKDHSYPRGEDDLPVTFVLKRDAEDFCRRANRRLPTSAEWEKAARGTDARAYPWGSQFGEGRANINRRFSFAATNAGVCKAPLNGSTGKLPGGSFPEGVSPYGCHDMAGNVWEWISDAWKDDGFFGLYQPSDARGILRGGAYGYSPLQARTSHQAFEALDATCHDVGFRCAMDAMPRRHTRERQNR